MAGRDRSAVKGAPARYVIGIDLGTTNCSLAFALKGAAAPYVPPQIETFAVPQVTAPGEQRDSPLLPSFLYFPLPEEDEAKTLRVSFDPKQSVVVGAYAKERGKELPTRLVSSAKSWLCHDGVDRRAAILPQNAGEGDKTISPVEGLKECLRHLKGAWNKAHKEAPLEEQCVLITVPASFDPAARELTLEAAALAGYPDVLLMEEPLAAFYAWLHRHADTWRRLLAVGETILVVDIGGGTTDFTLIAVEEEEGELSLRRMAVGSHLLLGGDNLDLALAYLAKTQLESQGVSIDDWQMHHLTHACREAKERLLTGEEETSVTIPGRGSRLIGGSLSTVLKRAQSEGLLVDGFFPLVAATERASAEKGLGMRTLGLPFAQDPRVTAHLATFLSRTGEGGGSGTDRFVLPDWVLVNGGSLKGAALQARLLEQLAAWGRELGKEAPRPLSDPDYDFSVSRGAAYYGLARQGEGIRVRGGASRSYFVGIESALPAVPGVPPPLQALCVVPFGMEEGTEAEVEGLEFSLMLGRPVTFRFFSRNVATLSTGEQARVGTIVRNWRQELTELSPIETHLDKGQLEGASVRVRLRSKVTELGMLELWCVAVGGQSWKLEFNLRHEERVAVP